MNNKYISFIAFFFAFLLICCKRDETTIHEVPDLSVVVNITNGRLTPDGGISSLPQASITITAIDDRYDTADFSVNYNVDGNVLTIPHFYLDLESHSTTLNLLSDVDVLSSVVEDIPDIRLSFLIKGTVTMKDDNGSVIEKPFNETVWIDTDDEISFNTYIGTPRGRLFLAGEAAPQVQTHETDTLLVLYEPHGAIFSLNGSISFTGTDAPSPIDVSQIEINQKGIIKIPFLVEDEVSVIRAAFTMGNSKSHSALDKDISVISVVPDEDFDFELEAPSPMTAGNSYQMTIKLLQGNSKKDYRGSIRLRDNAMNTYNIPYSQIIHFDSELKATISFDTPLIPGNDYEMDFTLMYFAGSEIISNTKTQEINVKWEEIQSVYIENENDLYMMSYPNEYEFTYRIYPENASCKDIDLIFEPEGYLEGNIIEPNIITLKVINYKQYAVNVSVTLMPKDGYGGYNQYSAVIAGRFNPQPQPGSIQ